VQVIVAAAISMPGEGVNHYRQLSLKLTCQCKLYNVQVAVCFVSGCLKCIAMYNETFLMHNTVYIELIIKLGIYCCS